MSCETSGQLHPYQSSRDVDGLVFDRETDADIAYDGITLAERSVNRPCSKQVKHRGGENLKVTRG